VDIVRVVVIMHRGDPGRSTNQPTTNHLFHSFYNYPIYYLFIYNFLNKVGWLVRLVRVE